MPFAEWNGEGNMYDYGFRMHDPRLGRFTHRRRFAEAFVIAPQF